MTIAYRHMNLIKTFFDVRNAGTAHSAQARNNLEPKMAELCDGPVHGVWAHLAGLVACRANLCPHLAGCRPT